MAIPPESRFDYLAVVPVDKVAPWRAVQHPEDRRNFTGASPFGNRFVGLHPTLSIDGARILLEAGGDDDAQVLAAWFDLDPELLRATRVGDVLRLLRTGSCGLGVSLSREGTLLAAVGAVSGLGLDPIQVQIASAPPSGAGGGRFQAMIAFLARRNTRIEPDWWQRETWIELRAGDERRIIPEGEEATAGGYGAYVVRSWRNGIPGTDESVAVYSLDGGLRDCAVNSARMLADGGLGWTGTGKNVLEWNEKLDRLAGLPTVTEMAAEIRRLRDLHEPE